MNPHSCVFLLRFCDFAWVHKAVARFQQDVMLSLPKSSRDYRSFRTAYLDFSKERKWIINRTCDTDLALEKFRVHLGRTDLPIIKGKTQTEEEK